jgi:hypothetical protein
MIKLGREQPVVSMDSGGKIIWARHNEIQMVNVKTATVCGAYLSGNRCTAAYSCSLLVRFSGATYTDARMHIPLKASFPEYLQKRRIFWL